MEKETNHSDRIWVNEVTPETAQAFCDQVLDAAEQGPGPVVIYINSPGGCAYSLGSMIGVLDSIPNPVITVAMGYAASAGAILLSHGTVRCAGQHATIMVHEVSGGAGGNVNDVVTDTNEITRLNDKWMSLLAQNCSTTLKGLRGRFTNERRDIYLSPQEALKFGIIDHVGVPTISKSNQFDLGFRQPSFVKTPKRSKK
jgi:ATP-dependent Clp protease protease subunit